MAGLLAPTKVRLGCGGRHRERNPCHYSDALYFRLRQANRVPCSSLQSTFAGFGRKADCDLTAIDASSFIPSSWNSEPDDDPAWSVPASYYAAAHASGETSLMTGEQLADLLNRQTHEFQPELKIHKVEGGKCYFGAALSDMVGVKIVINQVVGQFETDPLPRISIALSMFPILKWCLRTRSQVALA